jgi:hypothetical protein
VVTPPRQGVGNWDGTGSANVSELYPSTYVPAESGVVVQRATRKTQLEGHSLITVSACGTSTHYGTTIVIDAGADTSTSNGSPDGAAAAQLERTPPLDDRAPSPAPKKM